MYKHAEMKVNVKNCNMNLVPNDFSQNSQISTPTIHGHHRNSNTF